ncbi:FAD-dependent oxidoreductase [Ramlibacter sp.]|uniref:FAD-dependent oxidoreductase n=1 Tax=Ramlibacter sp. TaxID=1917967 RepID=UPI003D124CCB
MKPHAEIAGAGFGGLVAAVALAQRGWSVRVHERTPAIRAEGFAIAMQPNMLRVLESLGLREEILRGGLLIVRRETRDEKNNVTMALRNQGAHRVSRQHIVNVLAQRAMQLGVDVRAESAVAGADPSGELILASGERLRADLVIGADGVNSAVRDSLGLLARRRVTGDGATRVMIPRTAEEVAEDDTLGPLTCEYWSGTRRVITSPCSRDEMYAVMSCLASDERARAVPIDVESWSASFPHLASLFERMRTQAEWPRVKWSPFETMRLHAWSKGRVAVLGDAAHSMTPNLGQGTGCAMMTALALAASVDASGDITGSLREWERRERPLIEHTQRWSSLYGHVTVWPQALRSLAFRALGSVGWLRRQYQRTAQHIPTGYSPDGTGGLPARRTAP